jgi:hypothetical protein
MQNARFYHPTFRLNRRGEWLPTICRLGRSNGSNDWELLQPWRKAAVRIEERRRRTWKENTNPRDFRPRAASGQAAAPLSSVMNSRRLISDMARLLPSRSAPRRLPLAGLVAFSHLQFSQIRGRQPYSIVRPVSRRLRIPSTFSRRRSSSPVRSPLSTSSRGRSSASIRRRVPAKSRVRPCRSGRRRLK